MIEEPVRVVAVDGATVWVEARRRSACGGCAARSGCGHAALDRLGRRVLHLALPRPGGLPTLAPGDTVVLGVPERAVLWASLAVYAPPLLTLLLGAWVGQIAAPGDAGAAAGAALGLALGLLVVRALDAVAGPARYRPEILRLEARPREPGASAAVPVRIL